MYTEAMITEMSDALQRLGWQKKKDLAIEQFNAAMKTLAPDAPFIDNTDTNYYVATPCAPQASAIPAPEHQSITREEFAKITQQKTEEGGGALVWQIQVILFNDKSWTMPKDLGDEIIRQWQNGGNKVQYIWKYKDTQWGAWTHEERGTSISRYEIDLDKKKTKNLDSLLERQVQLVRVI